MPADHDGLRRAVLRPQAELEREALSVPAYGYLLGLVGTGQISVVQMETLIQCATQLAASPLEAADLGPLLEHVVFSQGPQAGPWRTDEAGGLPH